MNQHENFKHLCQETHSIVNSFIDRLVTIRVDFNPTTKILMEDRLKAFQFLIKMRLDFQPLFVTGGVIGELWEEIRDESVLQEMITEVTLKLLTHVQHDFHVEVSKALRFAAEVMTKEQGALDADYHERIVDPGEMETMICQNPWFATVLLIAMGRDEYVKPEFLNPV